MNIHPSPIPLVDLHQLHQPLQPQLEQALSRVMQRGDYILGDGVAAFEQAFAAACGAVAGVGVACGTDAIALGLQACGIGTGDEVILPANTFVATLIGVLRSGATPVFVDCDPSTALMDLQAVEQCITPRTRALIPVHLYGQMVSPQGLRHLAERHNLVIVEDAAQAHLAQREGYRAGAVGTASAFSFYPSKNLGAMGDGGMVVTQDERIAQTLRSLRNYGAARKYYHTELGTNSRLDTLQAAILTIKLPYLEGWNRDRYRIATTYDRLLAPLSDWGILPISNESGAGHVYHLYVIRLLEGIALDRETLQARLALHGIQTGIHYPVPCHLQPAFRFLPYGEGDFPQAERLCREVLSLPMYPGLTLPQVERVVEVLGAIVRSTVSVGSSMG